MRRYVNAAMLVRTPQLNEFTQALKEEIARTGDCVLVGMRNKLWVEVVYQEANDAQDTEERFTTPDHTRIWALDGRSITSDEFDLIEFTAKPAGAGDTP